MSSRFIFFLVFLFFLVIGAGSYYYKQYYQAEKRGQEQFLFLKTAPDPVSPQNEIRHQEKDQAKIDRLQELMKAAFEAKSKGDAGDKAGYERAVQLYGAALKVAPSAWLPLYNLADVYVLLKDYNHAEEYYQRALGSEKHQDVIWMGYLGFHQNYLKEPPDRMYPRYLTAVKESSGSVALTLMFAQFLVEQHREAEALPYFQLLAKNFPKDRYYADQVNKLQDGKKK